MNKFLSKKKCISICIIMVLSFVAVVLLDTWQPKEAFWVFDGDKSKKVYATREDTVQTIVSLAGSGLSKNDGYIFSQGNIIQVVRAVRVNVFDHGEHKQIVTSALSIADALDRAGVNRSGRSLYPAEKERPYAGMNIVLLNKNESVFEETQQIAFSVISRPDSHMELGETAVIKEGVPGSKNVLTKFVKMANGEKIRKVIVDNIIKQPKEQIVAMGTANLVKTSRGAIRFTKVIQMRASAYTPWDEGCIGITKMGIPAKHGVVAVDPDFIALGTRLYIPDYGYALAADIGGAIQGDRIDLCMETKAEAFQFGRRDIKVYILE